MRILVTGGAGLLGSHLVEALEPEHEVIVLDDFSAGLQENLHKVEVVKGSIRDMEMVRLAASNAEFIYHVAGLINVDESLLAPEVFHNVNAGGTLNVVKIANEFEIPLVHISTSEVYGSALYVPMDERHPLNPASPYAASKVAGEKYVWSFFNSFGSKNIIIRPFNYFGPRQKGNLEYGGVIAKNIVRILSGQAPVIRGGSQRRDYTYVKDVVKGVIQIAESGRWGEIVNLGQGYSMSVEEITKKIQEMCNTNFEPIHQPSREGDVQNLVADVTKAKELVGWQPDYSFEDGLRESIDWYAENLSRYQRYIFPSFRQVIP